MRNQIPVCERNMRQIAAQGQRPWFRARNGALQSQITFRQIVLRLAAHVDCLPLIVTAFNLLAGGLARLYADKLPGKFTHDGR